MHDLSIVRFFAILLSLLPALPAQSQKTTSPPLPDIHQLLKEVVEHQKQLEKVRENYTYSNSVTIQVIDGNGHVNKTETKEYEEFFVNGHRIGRKVKRDGKPLEGEELEKVTEHVAKEVERAQKLPPDQPLYGQSISISRVLEIVDVRNPRCEVYRGRPTIVFDFIGRKDAKTRGFTEDISKKLQGTVWIDEADRQIAHMDVVFNENFHIGGGIVANLEKGSNFSFDQAEVNGEVWLPTGSDTNMTARILLMKNLRQHVTERDYDFKRFHAEAEQGKDAKAVVEAKQ